MSVQLDFYHLYINATHEEGEAIHNSTEAQDVAKAFVSVGFEKCTRTSEHV